MVYEDRSVKWYPATAIFYYLCVLYLDHNSTSPVRPEVMDAIENFSSVWFANPSSSHRVGRIARQAVEDARDELRVLIGAEDSDLWFTSGSTESISWFFDSISQGSTERSELLVSEIEHKAVLESARFFAETTGMTLRHVKTLPDGVIDLDHLRESMSSSTRLTSVMTVNNETGAVQPLRQLCELSRELGAISFTDATQAVGKMSSNFTDLGPDALCFNAHKIGGPKGVGALVAITTDAKKILRPWTHGGGQEGGIRGGTLNVPAIVGLAVSVRLAIRDLEHFNRNCEMLGEIFLKALTRSGIEFELNCESTKRIPNTLSIWLVGVDAEALVARLHDVAISTGSACQSATQTPSHVLIAMNEDVERARQTVRVSFGWNSTREEAAQAANRVAEESNLLRQLEIREQI